MQDRASVKSLEFRHSGGNIGVFMFGCALALMIIATATGEPSRAGSHG